MYCPVMYGKQFELIALRELSVLVVPEKFKPIIEPVRNNLDPLIKTIETLNKANIEPFIIINPNLGDFFDESEDIYKQIADLSLGLKYTPCIKVEGSSEEYRNIISNLGTIEKAVYIRDGLNKEKIDLLKGIKYGIINKESPSAAINQLENDQIILIDDAFEKEKRNADYGSKSFFSDLHISYKNQKGISGFGDYTIVGSEYSESGGPAYVVTIHLSFIDNNEFDSMYIKHFSSDENSDSPTNPGGKFKDALNKVIDTISQKPKLFGDTEGIKEFMKLHDDKHYPGLGVVKKLSVKHHIQTICDYLEKK